MREKYNKELKELKNSIIEMGTMIEKSISLSVKGLLQKDIRASKEAISRDDAIDRKEKDIDVLCLHIIMEQQPVAGDLREISAAMKMIVDMERIGDHAQDISEIALILDKKDMGFNPEIVSKMASETMEMLIDSISAYVEKDEKKAWDVVKRDDTVDKLFTEARQKVVEIIYKDKNLGESAMDMLMIAKYFERIGDHAVNISEWVIFSITGIIKG